ncbi:uncharacterized protein DSM5745_00095 [Aspergillus mulundensis]|uniref:F-box domain-containing protein n=1 Tax=Aspergillus mulundensis TaxID=1810919 RepID=A0A3D8T2J4_9EURO|nr:hypothetical protein DSM5745_00095 [Aspergillus mulundensis]RDW92773.1 hypothetical protein DSM5745_00095 [Aspergillus mulundensis]
MPAKRKAAARSYGKAAPTPSRKRQRQEPLYQTDPFRHLPFDCATLILEDLDPVTILNCEQVDRGWAAFIRTWICAVGLRIHYPSVWHLELKQDEATSVWLYKANTAPIFTLPPGKASAVRKVEAHDGTFTIAGDFAAWGHGKHIYWQDLRFQDDGTFRPVQKLELKMDFGERGEEEEGRKPKIVMMRLNARGYLLLRFMWVSIETPQMDRYRDVLVQLQTGKTRWHYEGPVRADDEFIPRDERRLVGLDEHRVYYTSDIDILAVDIESGSELYRAPLPGTGRDRAYWIHFWPSKGAYTGFLSLNGRDVLVGLIPVRDASPMPEFAILVMDGATGHVIQQLPLTYAWSNSWRIVVSAEKTAFALVNEGSHLFRNAQIVRMFSAAPDGVFHEADDQIIDYDMPPDWPATAFDPGVSRVVADPFRHLLAFVQADGDKAGVGIAGLRPCDADRAVRRLKRDYGVKSTGALIKGSCCEVSLPPPPPCATCGHAGPGDAGSNSRRSLPIVPGSVYTVRFADERRLVIEVTRVLPRVGDRIFQNRICEYYVVDFVLRRREACVQDDLTGAQALPEEQPGDKALFRWPGFWS